MSDFIAVLSFSIFPLSIALIFSAFAPPLGATLYLRNEVLLGIALPSAGSAAIALAVALGVNEESKPGLFLVTVFLLFLLTLALPLGTGLRRVSQRRREIVLAAVLVMGNALTLTIMALSPRAESHLKHLLAGELLAVGRAELWAVGAVALLVVFLAYRFRGVLFALTIDEELFKLQGNHYALSKIIYRLVLVLVITAALMLVGPILCAALLIIPPLFAEGNVVGMEKYGLTCSLLGISGTLLGFMGGIALDLPPAPTAALGMALVGIVFKIAGRK